MKMVDSNEVEVTPIKQPEIVENNSDYFPLEEIPSQYKLYPEGTKILGRRLTVKEVKRLAELNDENANFIITDTLKNTIRGINVDDIKMQDQIYIILWLRANTYKEAGYVSEFVCSKCENVINHEFQLNDLNLIPLKDDFKEMKSLGENTIQIDFMSIKDNEDVIKLKDKLKDKDAETLGLASDIGLINGENLSLIEKYNFIENLDPCDYVKLKSYINKYQFGFEPTLNIECSKCKESSHVGISFRTSFFIPEYRY